MEYIFGTVMRKGVLQDNLKVVGSKHTDLSGFFSVVRNYSDSSITDFCKIVEKYLSKTDESGKCYDWYIIRDHYRDIDKYSKKIEALDHELDETEEGLMETYELSATNADDISDCRTALEELYETIIGE